MTEINCRAAGDQDPSVFWSLMTSSSRVSRVDGADGESGVYIALFALLYLFVALGIEEAHKFSFGALELLPPIHELFFLADL